VFHALANLHLLVVSVVFTFDGMMCPCIECFARLKGKAYPFTNVVVKGKYRSKTCGIAPKGFHLFNTRTGKSDHSRHLIERLAAKPQDIPEDVIGEGENRDVHSVTPEVFTTVQGVIRENLVVELKLDL
jgi:hypothetical protein